MREHDVRGGRRARGGVAVGRQHRAGARRRRRRRSSRRGRPRPSCSKRWPRRTIRAAGSSGAKALTGAARGGSDRDELARRLRALSSILRDLGVLLSRADERRLANADLRPLLERLQRSFDGERALRAFSAVDRALAALDRNASPKIVADWLAFQI